MSKLKKTGYLPALFCFVVLGLVGSPDIAEAARENPFDLPPGVLFTSQIKVTPETLVLQAIVIGHEVRTATINNRNYHEQDVVQGRLITRILPDRVFLMDDVGETELHLDREPFPIKVRASGTPPESP